MLYNREKDRWLSDKIDKLNSNDDVIDLQSQYVNSVELKKISKNSIYYEYKLPADFFHFSSRYSKCKYGYCEGIVHNYYFKNKDKNSYLSDGIKEPSFEFEESLCNISDDKLLAYYKNYDINDLYLS